MAEIGPEMTKDLGLPASAGKSRYVIAVTGASGMLYARELFAWFQTRQDIEVHAVCSHAGEQVLNLELGLTFRELVGPHVKVHPVDDFTAPLASGSFRVRAVVVIPCTMGTLGAIARGVPKNLIHRAAEVALKERRPLILVVRETPLSLVHLRSMVLAAEAGATIFPAMPGLYQRPGSLAEMARNFAGRVLDHLGLDHDLTRRWGE